MNHEKRIAKLERELAEVKSLLNSSGLNSEFIKLSKAAPLLSVNPWVIRDRIRNDPTLIVGKHYILNGSRYLINVKEYRKLMAADAKAKRR